MIKYNITKENTRKLGFALILLGINFSLNEDIVGMVGLITGVIGLVLVLNGCIEKK